MPFRFFACRRSAAALGAVVPRVTAEVTVPFADGVTDVGFKVQLGAGVTTGEIAQVSATVLVKLLFEVMVTVDVPDPPAVTVTVVGFAAMVKFEAAVTVNVPVPVPL